MAKLKYNIDIKPGDWTREDCQDGSGIADRLLFVSAVEPGGYEQFMLSFDGARLDPNGRPREWTDEQLFKAWVHMAKHLGESKTLGSNRSALARQVFEAVRSAILAVRGKSS